MQSQAASVDQYISELPEERKEAVEKLRKTINENLPAGFSEGMGYGMIGYVVPLAEYPAGYHCNPQQPLPFASLASQKNAISFYHMGLYADPELLAWFREEYPKHSQTKLDMGKSCVRFRKMDQIPYELIGELMRKMSPRAWIALYEQNLKK